MSLWVYAQNSDAVSSAALRAAVILAEPQAIYDITIATAIFQLMSLAARLCRTTELLLAFRRDAKHRLEATDMDLG